MDVRLKKEEVNISEQQDEKLTDSLIFNIIKKIELRMAMEEKYEVNRAPQLTIVPHNLGRYLHSTVSIGYLGLVISSIVYLRYKRKATISFQTLLPHFIIAITINEYQRYRNILNIDPQLKNQFKSYQQNTKTIIEQMKSRVSLIDQIQKIDLITFQKTIQMIRYKPIY